jgi:hypothetical protein
MECMMAHDPDNPKDWTDEEREALGHANAIGGAYAESLGRTDFAQWSPDEWQMLVNKIALAFTNRLRELTTSDDVPF